MLPVCVTKIEQRELLTLENPNYPEMLGRYPHLKGVRMELTDTKELLPIHVILGANEYTNSGTSTRSVRTQDLIALAKIEITESFSSKYARYTSFESLS